METHHTLHVPKTVDSWKQEIKKAIEIIKLNPATVTSVAADAKLLAPALIFVILGSSIVFSNFAGFGKQMIVLSIFVLIGNPLVVWALM